MRLRRLWQASAKHSDPAAPTEPTKSKSDIPSKKRRTTGTMWFVRSAPAVFDWVLDINVCPKCGAHETRAGWMKP